MANAGDQLIREVEEDLQRERWLRLWRAWGRQAIAAVVVVAAAVAGYTGWKEFQASRLADDGHHYWQASRLAESGDAGAAIASFNALAAGGHGAYPWLAGMREAALLAEAGERDAALRRYDELAAMDGVADSWRQLSALYAAMLAVDRGEPGDVEARLLPLLGGQWRLLALELQGLHHLDTGDTEAALANFREIAGSADAPASLAGRAGELVALITGGS